ncbi:MAG: ABC transporter ATP-binding protein [Syntrophomonas sp.]
MFEFVNVKYKNILDLPALHIEKKRITTLVGPSGSGKTTILRLLNKMISPTEGTILFNDTDLSQINSIAHRRQVTMLSQNPAVFEGNIRDNLTMGLKFQDQSIPGDDLLKGILEQVKIRKPLDSTAYTLSGGEKQRLALGRVLLLDPQAYLLDEPSSSLDDVTEEIIIEMVTKHVKEKGKTLIMVTHSQVIAEKFSDTIIEISGGKCLNKR